MLQNFFRQFQLSLCFGCDFDILLIKIIDIDDMKKIAPGHRSATPVHAPEWHLMEVLSRFQHTRQAGIDAIHGEQGSPEGKNLPSASRQNWGSVFFRCAQKQIQIHLMLKNREQTKACHFPFEQPCLTEATAEVT